MSKPTEGLYLFDMKLFDLSGYTIIFGPITVQVDKDVPYFNMIKTEFYVDNELMYTAHNDSFEWVWDDPCLGQKIIKVISYNPEGYYITDELEVWKFF